jgi:hypothetical protein
LNPDFAVLMPLSPTFSLLAIPIIVARKWQLWFRHKVSSVTSVAVHQVTASLNAHVLHTDWAWAEAALCIVCSISSAKLWIFSAITGSSGSS